MTRLLPLAALLLAGCGPTREEVGVAVLATLPAAWLGFGLLRRILGALKTDWATAQWRGWEAGLAATALISAVALVTAGRHLDTGLLPAALLTSVPSLVAFSLLLWRVLYRGAGRAVWLAPACLTLPYAVAALLLRFDARVDDVAIMFWVITGYAWLGPAVALLILGLEQLVRHLLRDGP